MREWVALIGATVVPMIVAFYVWAHVGLWACAIVCLNGGYAMARRDHNYRPRR